MFLFEFLGQPSSHLKDDMRASILDVLTPLAANKVEFISIDRVIEKLKTSSAGLTIDRDVVMQVLDPNEVKLVKKIEGDKIFLTLPSPTANADNEKEHERKVKKIHTTASKQAQKAVKKKSDGPLG
jgi:hypothetical protein